MIVHKDQHGNITWRGLGEPFEFDLNVEPDAAICKTPNYRFRSVQSAFGIYDSVVQRQLGWSTDRYYAAVRVEQPSDVEQIMVNAVLEAAKRCPGNSLWKQEHS